MNIVAISRADAPLIATEEQLVAALQAVEGLELESGLLMEVPASRGLLGLYCRGFVGARWC